MPPFLSKLNCLKVILQSPPLSSTPNLCFPCLWTSVHEVCSAWNALSLPLSPASCYFCFQDSIQASLPFLQEVLPDYPTWVLSWSPFLFLFLYLEHCVLRLWTCLSSSRSWKDSREGLWLTPPLCVSINTCGMNEWETGERKKGKEALLLFFHLRKRGVNMPLLKKKARRRGWSHSTNKSRGLSSSYLPFSSCHNKELQNCLLRLCKLS